MLNKIAYALSPLFPMFMVACSGNDVAGGTIDPNTIAEKSSDSKEVSDASSSSEKASVWSSSSNAVVTPTFSSSELSDAMSSSSEEVDVTDSPKARNFSIQCVEDVVYVDLSAPAVTPDVGEPVAYKRVEGDSVNLSLQNVYFDIPCDAEKQKIFMDEVNPVVGFELDTLYVNFSRSKGMVYDCSCAANASFTLDKAYSNFNYTVFDQKQPILVQTP
ncbi:hypothetical protein [Fibrobacter sp.]|uniref:hypothetical protein n=1 Tax=Fibrobacter sp. TaxID=35828 RepID=UPI0025BA260E|nr:hypothetical protein [Fibrobacter sp.]MBR3072409.1 hypothetical protein [Fibrobacter sp.]